MHCPSAVKAEVTRRRRVPVCGEDATAARAGRARGRPRPDAGARPRVWRGRGRAAGGAWRDCINIDDCGVGGAAHAGGRPCRGPAPPICADARFRRGTRSQWFRSPSPERGRGQTLMAR
ncbi:hypothetical protein VPH35_062956 [Triticum aestivum]